MNFHVGTSGYSYPEWKGSFYPAKLPAKQMLGFYAARFQEERPNYQGGPLYRLGLAV